jgi:hypothetical protein
MADRDEWIGDLQEGDTVIVSIRRAEHTETVTRVTPTQIKTANGYAFRRKDGRCLGTYGDFSRPWLVQATPERLASVQDKRNRTRLAQMSQSTIEQLTSDQVARIIAILNEPKR